MKPLRHVAVLFIAAMATFVAAQDRPPAREILMIKPIFLALRSKVKTELKITANEDQKILDAFNGTLEEVDGGIRLRLTPNDDLPGMEKSAIAVLTEAQRARLDEIWIQQLHGLALADPDVAKKLDLTQEQKRQADNVVDQCADAAESLLQNGQDADTSKKIEALREKFGKRIEDLLTDAQRKTYETLKGKPFKTS